jgi:hypothetical protein
MQPPQSEVEIVCSVQSHLEARVGWIVFAEDIEMTEIGDNGGKQLKPKNVERLFLHLCNEQMFTNVVTQI